MQKVVIDEPYEFVPPIATNFWPSLMQLYLPRYLKKNTVSTRSSAGMLSVYRHRSRPDTVSCWRRTIVACRIRWCWVA